MFPATPPKRPSNNGPIHVLGGMLLGEYSWRSGRAAITGALGADVVGERAKASLGSAKKAVHSVFHIDADKEHDKKLQGVDIDKEVTRTKDGLRNLRNAVQGAIKLYEHFVEPKKSDKWMLLLPDVVDWCKHELFCTTDEIAAVLHRDAKHVAALSELLIVLRGGISQGPIVQLKQAERCVLVGLENVCGYEIKLRDAVRAHEAAQERLNRTNAAMVTARADQRKATTPHAVASTDKAVVAALAAIEESKSVVKSSGAELARLETEEVPVALAAAAAAREEAERSHVLGACTALAAAYAAFARDATELFARSYALPPEWKPPARRPLSDKAAERFAELESRWALAQQRCEGAARQLASFHKGGLSTAISPPNEAQVLLFLSRAVLVSEAATQAEALLNSADSLASSRRSSEAALADLQGAFGSFVTELKTSCALVREHASTRRSYQTASTRIEKLGKGQPFDPNQLEVAAVPVDTTGDGKVDALAIDSNKDGNLDTIVRGKDKEKLHAIFSQSEKRKAELVPSLQVKLVARAKAIEDASGLRAKLDQSAAHLEHVAASIGNEGSALHQVILSSAAFVREYTAYCASRQAHLIPSGPASTVTSGADAPAVKQAFPTTLRGAATYLAVDAPNHVTRLGFASDEAATPPVAGAGASSPDAPAPPRSGGSPCQQLGKCCTDLCTILRFTGEATRTKQSFII